MAKAKTLIPNDFRDYLSLISIAGFLGIFLAFTFGITWINDNLTAIFLILGGASFLVLGKVFTIKSWIRDGIQRNEFLQVISLTIGLSSMIIGILLFASVDLPERILGIVGIIAVFPMLYIIIDYFKKNTRRY